MTLFFKTQSMVGQFWYSTYDGVKWNARRGLWSIDSKDGSTKHTIAVDWVVLSPSFQTRPQKGKTSRVLMCCDYPLHPSQQPSCLIFLLNSFLLFSALRCAPWHWPMSLVISHLGTALRENSSRKANSGFSFKDKTYAFFLSCIISTKVFCLA